MSATTEQPKTQTYAAAVHYVKAGISVIPVFSDGSKRPALDTWKELQERLPTAEELCDFFAGKHYLGIVCGRVSSHLLIIDFDEAGLYEQYEEAAAANDLRELVERCVRVQTPSGGCHLYLRSLECVGGNTKLARAEDGHTLIETRGEGGQAVAPPSGGYALLRGRPDAPPTLAAEEVEALLSLARLFNLFTDPRRHVDDAEASRGAATARTGQERNRPGDAYNSRGDVLELLQHHGWRVLYRHGDVIGLQRPGKDGRGASATLNYGGCGLFYVFSTNAAPFESDRSYSPFAVYTWLEHNRDFAAATRALGKAGYGEPPRRPHSPASEGTNGSRARAQTAETAPAGDSEEDVEEGEEEDNPLNGDLSLLELAQRWAKSAENMWCYVEGDQWWLYEDNRWQYSSMEAVTRAVQEFLIPAGRVSPARVRNVLFLAKSMLGPHRMTQFNRHPNWIPLANGVFDTASSQLIPHDPAHKLTYMAPYEYDANADCPTWKQCLREWMIRENGAVCQEWIDILQEWFGYCLIPDNRAQASMLWNGEGGNGKGTATRVLESLVGVEYTTAIPIEQLHNEYQRAELHGKLVGFVNEPDTRAMSKNGNWFKAIVGGDSISARRPTEKVFTFVPTVRVIISTNELPSTRDTSAGYYRRLIMIDWRYSVPYDKRDPDLDEKMRLELPGIFNWAIEGLHRYRARRKFDVPEESRKLLEGYRESQDNIGRFIGDECSREDPFGQVRAKTIYTAYRRWCEDYGCRSETENMFGRRLTKLGCTRIRVREDGMQIRKWEGISLLNDPDNNP